MQFVSDVKVVQVAEAYAMDFVEYAQAQFSIALDYSIGSLAYVDQIAAQLVASKPRFRIFNRGMDAKLEKASKMMGFYVAETFHRAWSAEHGWVIASPQQRFYGLRLANGDLCWPVGRAEQRLNGGPENDFVGYAAGLSAMAQSTS